MTPSADVWGAIAARVAAAPARTSAPSEATSRPTTGATGAPRSAPSSAPARAGTAKRRAPRWSGWATGGLAASLVLAAALGVWGVDQRQDALALRAELATERAAADARASELLGTVGALEANVGALEEERARVAQWLSEGEVAVAAIAGDGGAVGSVLYRADGAALVVMRDGPGPGRSLQAWGVAAGAVTSLGAFEGRVLEVASEGFEAVAVSLEPLGGSATPTEVLGAAPRS